MTTPPAGYDLTNDQDREDRRSHLELISATIARMSTASSMAKGWAITLATAAFGAGAVKSAWYLVAIGIVVVAAFLYLDVRYLDTEKRFRDLYDAVLANAVVPLSMDTRNLPPRSRNESYKSRSIRGLYVPMLLVGVALLVIALVESGRADPKPERPRHPGWHHTGERAPTGGSLQADASLGLLRFGQSYKRVIRSGSLHLDNVGLTSTADAHPRRSRSRVVSWSQGVTLTRSPSLIANRARPGRTSA